MGSIKLGQRAELVRDFSIVGIVVLILFALENYYRANYAMAWVEGGIGVLVIINLLTFWRYRWIETAAVMSAVGVLVVLLIMYISGGMGGTGVYWYFVFPVVTFYLVKRNAGYALFGLLMVLTVGLLGGGEVGYWRVAYNGIETRQLLISYLVVGILIAYYQRASDIYEKEINDAKNNLEITSQKLLSEQVAVAAKRQELENNQAAMLNLLEDERELEEQLKKQKASVEQQVLAKTGELRAIIESINRGLMVVDRERKVVLQNQKLGTIVGGGELMYLDLVKFLESEVDLEKMVTDCFAHKENILDEAKLFGNRYLTTHVVPVLEQDRIEAVAIFIKDVTEAMALQRSRDEFFSIASHELRTPLTAIRGNAEMIMDNFADQIKNKDVTEMLADIREGSIRLIEIVNDFLNVSRLEMGKMEFKHDLFDLVIIAREVVKEFEVTGASREVQFTVDAPQEKVAEVVGDTDRVKQVLFNLLGNALKFTKKGKITVKIIIQPTEVQLHVIDSGEGIAKEMQGLLFHKFQQAGSSLYTRDTSRGTGLGLYISKLMMEGMGGKIWLVKSTVGKGSTFALSLPIAQSKVVGVK